MKLIKKVNVTPVQSYTGQIIDSFSTEDNKHTNAPSINAVENYVQSNIENYSENEQKIGSWFGKPLYSKVITYTFTETLDGTSSFAQIDIPHQISNFKECVEVSGFLEYESQTQLINNGGWSPSLSSMWLRCINLVTTSIVRIRVVKDTIDTGTKIDLILKYTKTTD